MPKMVPPFFPNFEGSQCWQCALRSILEYFDPEKAWTPKALDTLTGRHPHKYTWPMKSFVELPKLGYELVSIELFDYDAFAADARGYMTSVFSDEFAKVCFEKSVMEDEIQYTKEFLKEKGAVSILARNSTAEDIKTYLNQGYLIIHWVDSARLNEREGCSGHYICVYDENGEGVFAHDSGGSRLESHQPARFISYEKLMDVATDNGKTGGFYAIRKKEK